MVPLKFLLVPVNVYPPGSKVISFPLLTTADSVWFFSSFKVADVLSSIPDWTLAYFLLSLVLRQTAFRVVPEMSVTVVGFLKASYAIILIQM